MKAYPAPERQRWSTSVEFLDGTTIHGTSDSDVILRWCRLTALWDERAADPAVLKAHVAERCRGFYGAALIGIDAATPDEQFLDALAAERCITLRRK